MCLMGIYILKARWARSDRPGQITREIKNQEILNQVFVVLLKQTQAYKSKHKLYKSKHKLWYRCDTKIGIPVTLRYQ